MTKGKIVQARIGPTGYDGTFGILWSDFPVGPGPGGYSGPFTTQQDAEARARAIADAYGYSLAVSFIPTVNP